MGKFSGYKSLISSYETIKVDYWYLLDALQLCHGYLSNLHNLSSYFVEE